MYTKYMACNEGMTSSTHSFAYSYRLVKKGFVKFAKLQSVMTFSAGLIPNPVTGVIIHWKAL